MHLSSFLFVSCNTKVKRVNEPCERNRKWTTSTGGTTENCTTLPDRLALTSAGYESTTAKEALKN